MGNSISENAKFSCRARQGEMRNTLTEEPSRPLIGRIKPLKQNKATQTRVAEAPFLDLIALRRKMHTAAPQ